jgi:predicted amidohydrolase YtcJ
MAASYAIVNAHIRTMDPDQPIASAVAWEGERIIAVGTDAAIREVVDGKTQVRDANGATLTPGLVDGHQHLLHGSEFAQGLNLDRVHTLSDLREKIAQERRRIGPDAWLMGFALEYAAFEGASYHHSILDEVSGPGPMFLYTLDVHTGYANGRALEIAKLNAPVNLSDGSIVSLGNDDKPTGELLEMAAMQLVLSHVPEPTRDEKLKWYAQSIADQNSLGITEIHMMDGNLDSLEIFRELEGRELLNMRVLQHHFVYPYTPDDEVEAMVRSRNDHGVMWQADGVKFMLDGVIDTGTAWLEEPDAYGDGTEPMWPDLDLYHSRARKFHDAGFRIATHAIGDRAVREVLDFYSSLPEGSQGKHRIEHIETSPDATVARFAPERVTASMQPIHTRWVAHDMTDPWSQRLGAHRCGHAWRSGDIFASGALVVLGSDWPVAPYDPRMGFFAAQERRAHDVSDPRPIGNTRALTAEQTLAGYTVNPAKAVGKSGHRGMVKVGMSADLVLWQDDPVRVSPTDIVDMPILQTVANGKVVFNS